MASTKHKCQRLVFNPANQKLLNFNNDLQKLARNALGVAAQAIIERFIYAKVPPHLEKSISQAHLENGTYEQIVSHLETELELNGLEAPDELKINTLTQQTTQQSPEKPKATCHHCKKLRHYYRNQSRQLKREKYPAQNNTNSASNKNNNNGVQKNSNSNNKVPNNTNSINTSNQNNRNPGPVYPQCETCGKTNHSTENYYFGANAANRPPPRNRRPDGQNEVQQRNAQNNSVVNVQAAAQILNQKRHVFPPEFQVTDGRQLKHQNFHQIPRLSGSILRRYLQINTTQIKLIMSRQYSILKKPRRHLQQVKRRHPKEFKHRTT